MDQDQRLRQRAYEIWESEGRPEGQDRDHWLRAELEQQDQAPASPEAANLSEDVVPSGASAGTSAPKKKAAAKAAGATKPKSAAKTAVKASGKAAAAPKDATEPKPAASTPKRAAAPGSRAKASKKPA